MELDNEKYSFESLGKGLAFPLKEDPATGSLLGVEGAESLKEDVRNLLGLRVGERVMAEDRGTLIPETIFESVESAIDILPFRVAEAMRALGNRLVNVRVEAKPLKDGPITGVSLSISWEIRSSGRRDGLVWPYYLGRAGGEQ